MGGLRTFRRVPPHQEETINRRNLRRSVRRLIDLRLLCVGASECHSAVARALAAVDRAMDTRRYTKLRPGTAHFGETSTTMTHACSKGRLMTWAPPPPVHLTSCRGTTA